MVKLDLKTLRETVSGAGNGEEHATGKNAKLDALKLQEMKLEEAQWRALAGGEGEKEDPLDKIIEKMYQDYRRKQLMKEIGGNGGDEENSTIRQLQKQIEEMQRKYDELEKQRKEEERERKIAERFEKLERMILESHGKKNGDEDALSIALKEIEKMREEDRKERERERQEAEKEKERAAQIEELRDEMAEHQRRLEDMIRDGVGKKDQGFLAELKQFKETQEALDKLIGRKGEGEKEMSISDTLDEITDKAPKIAQSVRSIYDLAKGTKEEDTDIGPMETVEEETPQGRTAQHEEKSAIEKYVDEGYEIDDPDHPGQKMFVGLYKDYYVDQAGKPLTKAAVQLIAKTNPQLIEKTMQEAREQYFREQAEMRKVAKQASAPAPEEKKEAAEKTEAKSESAETPAEEPDIDGTDETADEDLNAQ